MTYNCYLTNPLLSFYIWQFILRGKQRKLKFWFQELLPHLRNFCYELFDKNAPPFRLFRVFKHSLLKQIWKNIIWDQECPTLSPWRAARATSCLDRKPTTCPRLQLEISSTPHTPVLSIQMNARKNEKFFDFFLFSFLVVWTYLTCSFDCLFCRFLCPRLI